MNAVIFLQATDIPSLGESVLGSLVFLGITLGGLAIIILIGYLLSLTSLVNLASDDEYEHRPTGPRTYHKGDTFRYREGREHSHFDAKVISSQPAEGYPPGTQYVRMIEAGEKHATTHRVGPDGSIQYWNVNDE